MSKLNDLIVNGANFEEKFGSAGDVRIEGRFNNEISVNGTLSIDEGQVIWEKPGVPQPSPAGETEL